MTAPRSAACLGVLAFAAAVLPARAEDPEKTVPAPCRAEILAEHASVRPGADATLGVRLVPDAGWHVYWRNPGESGLAPSVEWTLPAGYEAGVLQWPAPHRFEADGIVGYGYDADVLLPVTLKVPAGAKAGEATIAARVRWLACSDTCIPGDTRLELRLAVKDAAPEADARVAAQFARARERLPRTLPGGAARIVSAKDRVDLTVESKDLPPDVASVAFFPAEELVLDPSVAATIESTGAATLRVRLMPAPRREETVRRLQGVLAVVAAAGTLLYEIDAVAAENEPEPGPAGEKGNR